MRHLVIKINVWITKTRLTVIFSSVSLQDIREAIPDLSILAVTIERNDGRYKAGARLALERPEVLDDWPKSRQNVYVRNKEVSVCVGSSDGWLCVAKLPLDYTDDQFLALAGAYGRVREAFLMASETTGALQLLLKDTHFELVALKISTGMSME